MTYNYKIIRSDRRTLALEISDDARLVIRAPRHCPTDYIESFVGKHTDWIDSHIERQRLRVENAPVLTEEETAALIQRARAEIPPIVEHYEKIMGLTPSGISITRAQKRFGSCNAQNRLRFSYRLMLYPQSAVEYVVVHELSHIVHKNHGRDFYALIKSVLPDYKEREALLKRQRLGRQQMLLKEKTENEAGHKQGRLYRFLRGVIRVFTKKMETVWEEPFRGRPSVFVCNHDRAFGPIAMCAHFELSEDVRPWINAQVLSARESPEYIRHDYWWNLDKWYSPILSHTLVYIYALILPPILRGADCVPVYHDTGVMKTLRQSIKTLADGKHLLLFPEHPTGFQQYGQKIFDGFVSVGRLYYGRTKETVDFYPTYVDWKKKKIFVGSPIAYDPGIEYEEQVSLTTAAVEAFFGRFSGQ